MTSDEKNILRATAGLALVILGALLPWARIGGRSRSGFSTADTFLALGSGGLPDVIAWVGRWWYLPAFLAFLAWATTFTAGTRVVRVCGVLACVVAVTMWGLFVWAGDHYRLLNTTLTGPLFACTGLVLIAVSCSRRRGSIIRRPIT